MNAIERWKITDHAEWLHRRRANINGSEVAALFGCNPFMTNLALYAEKADLAKLPAPDSDVLRRGRILEPAVAAGVLEERPDWKISKANEYLWSPAWRLGCTPDFHAHCPRRGIGVVQTKTAAKPIFDEDWQDGPPQWIVLQTLQEMMLEDVAWGAIALLVMNFYTVDIHIWEFERHAPAEKRMIQKAAMFWDAVAERRQPAFNFDEDADVIKALFPRANNTTVDFTNEPRMAALLTEHESLKAIACHAEKRLKPLKAEIAAMMGEAGTAIVPGFESVTFKNQERAGFTTAPTSFRVLRTKRAATTENPQ